jgi:hypothetical protein
MITGNRENFTKEHIEKNRHNTSSVLAEQVVHSLELVSLLVYEGLDFLFKGGNSLLVLLENPQRFSIDVDIASGETKEHVEEILDKLVKDSDVFTRWEKRVHKTKPWLPMTSYYMFYTSHFTEPAETNIMLDVQLRMTGYEKIQKPVCCGNFYQSEIKVWVPSISSLIGDKLLTLGPSTLGIPLNKNKEGQRLKHSFDVSLLAEHSPSIEKIKESINFCMEQENSLQKKNLTIKEVYEDTIKLCRSVLDFKEEPPLNEDLSPYLYEIVKGRKPFSEHLLCGKYSWQNLQIDLARVAVCFSSVMAGISDKEFHEILNYNQSDRLSFYWNKIENFS